MIKVRDGDGRLRGEVVFASYGEDGSIDGEVAVSKVDGQAWIHDLYYSGDSPMEAVKLMSRARQQVKDWGMDTFWMNVCASSPFLSVALSMFKMEQVVFTGNVKEVQS